MLSNGLKMGEYEAIWLLIFVLINNWALHANKNNRHFVIVLSFEAVCSNYLKAYKQV